MIGILFNNLLNRSDCKCTVDARAYVKKLLTKPNLFPSNNKKYQLYGTVTNTSINTP